MPALPRLEFESQQIAVEAMTAAHGFLSAHVDHAAVVAREKDQRVFGEPEFVERAQELADHPVEFVDEVAVDAALARAAEARMRRERMMDVSRGEIEEEGLARAGFDPCDGFLREARADLFVVVKCVRGLAAADLAEAHFLAKLPRLGRLIVDERIVRHESDHAAVLHPDEGRVTVHDRHAKKGVEAEFERTGLQFAVPIGCRRSETEVPLAETRGAVAGALHHVRERGALGIDHEALFEKNRHVEPAPERILAREQRVA